MADSGLRVRSAKSALKSSLAAVGLVAMCSAVALADPSIPLHPGDSVTVTVYNHPEISTTTRVSAYNTLTVPLVGSVDVQGLTSSQASSRIQYALRRYVRQPSVQVQVTGEGASIFVTGTYTGVLPYLPGETLANALAQLESPPQQGNGTPGIPAPGTNGGGQETPSTVDFRHSGVDLTQIRVLRDGKALGTFNLDKLNRTGSPGMTLAPGDTIALQSKPTRVEIQGDVRDPGQHYLGVNEPISQAVQDSGGALPDASTRVALERDGKTAIYSMGSPEVSVNPAQPGDVLTLHAAPRVNVVGLVATPSMVTLRDDQTLLSAIYLAGGPQRRANLKDIRVIENGKTSDYNIAALTHGDTSQNPQLTDGAVVLVPEAKGIQGDDILNALGSLAGFALRF